MCRDACCTDADGERGRDTNIPDGGQSALNRVLDALSDERCRYLCYYLSENEPTDLEECTDAVAAREEGCTQGDVPAAKRQRVKTGLHHHQLPKLTDLAIVEYDQRSGTLRYRDPPPHFEEFLRLASDIESD